MMTYKRFCELLTIAAVTVVILFVIHLVISSNSLPEKNSATGYVEAKYQIPIGRTGSSIWVVRVREDDGTLVNVRRVPREVAKDLPLNKRTTVSNGSKERS